MKKNILIMVLIAFTYHYTYSQYSEFKSTLDSIKSLESNYGNGNSIGFSILGSGGIAGIMHRRRLSHQDQLEFNLSPGVQLISYGDNDRFSPDETFLALSVMAGYNFFLGSRVKINERKSKIRKNYLSIKGEYLISEISSLAGFITWHREGFNIGDENYSRGLDLGLGFGHYLKDSYNGFTIANQQYVSIFLRFDWNWFR